MKVIKIISIFAITIVFFMAGYASALSLDNRTDLSNWTNLSNWTDLKQLRDIGLPSGDPASVTFGGDSVTFGGDAAVTFGVE